MPSLDDLPEDAPDDAVIAAEQEKALDLFIAGKDYRFIAAALGRSVSTAHKRVQDALHGARKLKAEEYVTAELALYQQLQDRLMQRLVAGVAPEKVIPHVLAVSKEKRGLMGWDAPKRLRVDLPAPEVEVPDVGFARVVEEAERDAAVDEESIADAG